MTWAMLRAMVDLDGKRVCIAGKLVGPYASRLRELEHRLQRMGAALLPKFDASADLVVMGAKSKGFAKRVAKSGATTMTEAELETLVEDALTDAAHRSVKRKSAMDVWRGLAGHAKRPTHQERHDAAIAELRDARAHGYEILLEGDLALASRGTGAAVLFLCRPDGCRLYAATPELPDPLRIDLEALAGRSVYSGDDCPVPILLAFLRLQGALGGLTERLWTRVRGELENRDETPDAHLPPLESHLRQPGLAAIETVDAIPAIHHIYAVLDELTG